MVESVTITIRDYLKQWLTYEDGQVISDLICSHLSKDEHTTVSFEGIDSVPSSFINGAFITLLEKHDFNEIRRLVHFSHTTKSINSIIKQRFDFEVNKRKAMDFA